MSSLLEQIVLGIALMFWAALIGSLFYRFQVSSDERAEYDRMITSFSYVVAILTIGSIAFWVGDDQWRGLLQFFMSERIVHLKMLALIIFWLIAFGLFIKIFWRRRSKA